MTDPTKRPPEPPPEDSWLHWQSSNANWPHAVVHRLGIEAVAVDKNEVLRVRLPEDKTDLPDRWAYVGWEDFGALEQGIVSILTGADRFAPNRTADEEKRLWVDRSGTRHDSDWWTNDPQILAAVWRYIAPHKLDPNKEIMDVIKPGARPVIPWEESVEIRRRTLAVYPWRYYAPIPTDLS